MIVIGTLLNDEGAFFESCKMSLCKELFADKRNAFVYGIIEGMHKAGLQRTFPLDVFNYANENDVKYGNAANFCAFLCEMAENFAFKGFKKYVKELVTVYLRNLKYESR